MAVLSGAVGDYLARTSNGLALPMSVMVRGEPVSLHATSLARAFPAASSALVVFVHGLMATEHDWRMTDGKNYGTLLADELPIAPLHIRYNSGRAIVENGADLAALLDQLVAAWPVPPTKITLIGHSMGGLVIRAAFHAGASHAWLRLVTNAIYLGTPHRGAPLERVGRVVQRVLHAVPDPVTRLIADVAALRSAGIQNLGDPRYPVPMPRGIAHHLIAGTATSSPQLASLFGDGMVSVSSATDGRAPTNRERLGEPVVTVLPGIGHMALCRHPLVFEKIRADFGERT